MSSGGDEIPGGRIVWARLEGAQVNTFVVAAYVPYEDHQKPPFQCDVINQIDKTIEKNSRSGDQIIVMMDANSRLKRGLSGYTGKWAVHKKSDKGGKQIIDMMKKHDLLAANTFFQPKSAFGKRC